MSNIIPVLFRSFKGNQTQCANAKRLHAFLGVGRDFSNWIKYRIKQYGFEEGVDYITISRTPKLACGNLGASSDYFLTLDMAKELAMVERNEKGREARRYFIECENQLKQKQPPKALPTPKKYSYPRKLLEQDGFFTDTRPAALNIFMLSNKHYVPPLMHLLNELRTDGNEVSAAWDEAIAMREGILQANTALEEIYTKALRSCHRPASTSGNK